LPFKCDLQHYVVAEVQARADNAVNEAEAAQAERVFWLESIRAASWDHRQGLAEVANARFATKTLKERLRTWAARVKHGGAVQVAFSLPIHGLKTPGFQPLKVDYEVKTWFPTFAFKMQTCTATRRQARAEDAGGFRPSKSVPSFPALVVGLYKLNAVDP
jgi:hypothetical protein